VPLTFPQKLLMLLLLAVVTPTALSVLAFSEIMRSYMEDRSLYDGRSLGGVLATNLSGRVDGGWGRADRVLMDYLAADDSVAFICVTDRDGRPIHMSVHDPSVWEAYADSQRESFNRGYLDVSRDVAIGAAGDGLVIRTVPIYAPGEAATGQPNEPADHEGYVVLGTHDVSFLAAARRFQLTHILLSAAVTILLAPLILLAYFRWSQPLRHLRANVIKLADGKAPLAIEAKEDDDIGRLVSAVDRMAGSVIAAQRQLRDTNTNLESIVQQRTIELREAVRELEQLSTTDVLTGLANRRAFYRQLENDYAHAAAYRGELGLLMMDLDGFKQINDTYGHDVGDDVLITVGEAIMSCSDSNMTPARLGGDEFVILIRHLSVQECSDIAASISEAFAALLADRLSRFDPIPAVTLSLGLASLRDSNAEGGEILMAMADIALYRAKSRGRSCLVVYDESMARSRREGRRATDDHMEAA
jgi:diguanylate cyclase (GGDEF)-like protein